MLWRRSSRKSTDELNPLDLQLSCVRYVQSIDESYKVGELLGHGQSADVFQGTHRKTGMAYALKRLDNKGLREDAEELEGVRTEISVLQQLEHKYVIKLHEVISTPQYTYLVMDLITGGDLLAPVESKGSYSEKRAQRLFAQLVLAVEHLHLKGIVHRDIKLENICYNTSASEKFPDIKLIDLGSAAVCDANGSGRDLTELCGTPMYAAPEVVPWFWKDEESGCTPPTYGREVDYWSMGVTLFVMLSGEAPFNQEQEVDDLLRDVRAGSWTFSSLAWKHISVAAKDLVRALLVTDPADRIDIKLMRTHAWLRQAISSFEAESAETPATNAAVVRDAAEELQNDLELGVALKYLPTAFVGNAVGAVITLGCVSWTITPDVGELGTDGGLAVTVGIGAEGAYVNVEQTHLVQAPVEPPRTRVQCTRSSMVALLQGSITPPSLCVQHMQVDNPAVLVKFLGNFHFSKSRFRSFCAEQGLQLEATHRTVGFIGRKAGYKLKRTKKGELLNGRGKPKSNPWNSNTQKAAAPKQTKPRMFIRGLSMRGGDTQPLVSPRIVRVDGEVGPPLLGFQRSAGVSLPAAPRMTIRRRNSCPTSGKPDPYALKGPIFVPTSKGSRQSQQKVFRV